MKKTLFVVLLMAISGLFTVNGYAGDAFDQLQNIDRDSEAATREPTDEGASEGAGQGIDTNSDTPVYLNEGQDTVDPADLQQ